MDLFWKTVAGILVSVILVLAVGKQEKDLSAILAIAVCCMAGTVAMRLMEPILDFLYHLQELAFVDSSLFNTLFKLLGISLVCEIASVVCGDAGCHSFGKSIQILGSAVILYLSLPVLQMFLSLVEDIMGGL